MVGSVRQSMRLLREEMDKERSHTMYRGPTTHERDLMQELAEILAREEEKDRSPERIG